MAIRVQKYSIELWGHKTSNYAFKPGVSPLNYKKPLNHSRFWHRETGARIEYLECHSWSNTFAYVTLCLQKTHRARTFGSKNHHIYFFDRSQVSLEGICPVWSLTIHPYSQAWLPSHLSVSYGTKNYYLNASKSNSFAPSTLTSLPANSADRAWFSACSEYLSPSPIWPVTSPTQSSRHPTSSTTRPSTTSYAYSPLFATAGHHEEKFSRRARYAGGVEGMPAGSDTISFKQLHHYFRLPHCFNLQTIANF